MPLLKLSALRRVHLAALSIPASIALVACTSPGASPSDPALAATCNGWKTTDYAEARVIRKFRVYTNRATGDSAIEETVMPPKGTPLLKTGRTLLQYDFGPTSKTQIVYGPGDLELPMHPAPGRESFLILQGSATLRLGDGTTRQLGPGDMTTYDDMDARIGHGGRTGPCGYVALNLVP